LRNSFLVISSIPEILDFFLLTISFIFLSYASWSDLKKREVSNKVWAIFFPIAIAFTLIRIALGEIPLFLSLLSIALTFFVSFILLELNFFGGADFKAIVCIGIAFPSFPKIFNSFKIFLIAFHPFFPLVVLYNAYFFSSLTIFYMVFKNFFWILKNRKKIFEGFEEEAFWKKLLVFLTCYKKELKLLKNKSYLYPMEEIVKLKGKKAKKLKTFIEAELEEDEYLKRIEELKAYDEEMGFLSQAWVTPGLPMIAFLTLAFILSSFLGDVFFLFMLEIFKTILSNLALI